MSKVTPFLWFDSNAEEAINYYVSLLPNSKIISISKYPDEMPGLGGKVMHADFELDGQRFNALDGGPTYKLNEAFSIFVDCENQEEVDRLWNALTSNGGEESMCGWLKDRFGMSWQIIPKQLGELMMDQDKAKSQRVMNAMLKMKKIVVADLEAAANAA